MALLASKRVRALWSALALWRAADRSIARLARAYGGPQFDLLSADTDFQVARLGEDPRFARPMLRVPPNVLSDTPADVL